MKVLIKKKVKTQVKKEFKSQRVLAIPCEVYSRVVGYFRPVQNWNIGKQQEFNERKTVKLETFQKIKCLKEGEKRPPLLEK